MTDKKNQDFRKLESVLRYPRIPAPPCTEFVTKMMPGAHYKLSGEEFDDIKEPKVRERKEEVRQP